MENIISFSVLGFQYFFCLYITNGQFFILCTPVKMGVSYLFKEYKGNHILKLILLQKLYLRNARLIKQRLRLQFFARGN